MLWTQHVGQRTLTYFVRGSITVQLISCLTGLDLAEQVNLLLIQHKLIIWIQTSQAGGQLYCDTFPYEVSEWSLFKVFMKCCRCTTNLPTYDACWASKECIEMFFDTNFRGKMAKQSLQKATGLIRKVSVAKVNVKCQKRNFHFAQVLAFQGNVYF